MRHQKPFRLPQLQRWQIRPINKQQLRISSVEGNSADVVTALGKVTNTGEANIKLKDVRTNLGKQLIMQLMARLNLMMLQLSYLEQ